VLPQALKSSVDWRREAEVCVLHQVWPDWTAAWSRLRCCRCRCKRAFGLYLLRVLCLLLLTVPAGLAVPAD
jgi:hypothetical protein